MHNRGIVCLHFYLCIFNDIRSTWGRQTQQVWSTEKNDHWLSHYWLKSQEIKQTSQWLTHVNISNVNVQLGTKRAYQESKYVANKHNGLETGCKAQQKCCSVLWPFFAIPTIFKKPLNAYPVAQLDDIRLLRSASIRVQGKWVLAGEQDHFSDHRNQSHRWRRVTHPLWQSRRCKRSPVVWSGFLRSHAERSPGRRRPTCRNPTPSHRLDEDTQGPSFQSAFQAYLMKCKLIKVTFLLPAVAHFCIFSPLCLLVLNFGSAEKEESILKKTTKMDPFRVSWIAHSEFLISSPFLSQRDQNIAFCRRETCFLYGLI